MEGGSALSLLLPIALFVIMLGMGLSLELKDFTRVLKRPGVICTGLLFQVLVLPLLALIVVMVTDLPALLACGLMIVSFAPGGATSNMISHLCRADTALSISLTGLTSLIVPFTLPWFTWLALEQFNGEGAEVVLPLAETIMKLLLVTIVPVILGLIARRRWEAVCMQLQRPVKILSLTFMFTVVTMIGWANREHLPELLPVLTPAVLLLACGVIMLVMGACRWLLQYSSSISLTIAIETAIQNAGTGLMVTGAILQQPEMSLAVLMYGILMQVPALLLIIWRNRPFYRHFLNSQ